MPKLGFTIDTTTNTPTLAVLLETGGGGVQSFYCDQPFRIIFPNKDWPGEGKGIGTGGTKPFQNKQEYKSGNLVGGNAVIMLKFKSSATPTQPYYKFNVKIDGYANVWDPRVIPD